MIHLDSLLQLLLLDERIAFARESFSNQLVVQPELPTSFHGPITVLDTLLIVPLFKIYCRPAADDSASHLLCNSDMTKSSDPGSAISGESLYLHVLHA